MIQRRLRTLCIHLSISFVAFTGILLCLDKAFYYLNNTRSNITYGGRYNNGFFLKDTLLGYKPKPNIKTSSVKKYGEQTLYSVAYSIGEDGYRITPGRNEERNKFILFFGCSFTFGEGVNDNETMPYFVSSVASTHQVYNFGFCGYGPQQMLAKLTDDKILQEVKEKSGVLVYTGDVS